MSRYDGIDAALREAVVLRDGNRCRWCARGGTTGRCSAHHIRYRRGESDDIAENLILLCYECHGFVHDSYRIPKQLAQRILFACIGSPGTSGLELYRRMQRSDVTDDRLSDSALLRRMRGET